MTDHKQYVNVDPESSDERREIQQARAGKNIRLTASIDKQVEGVPIVFEIRTGDDNINSGLDDANFSFGERAVHFMRSIFRGGFQNPGVLRRRVLTNDEGEATIDFVLSECGGDEFEAKAFLRGRESDALFSDKYIVWRRVYYQISRFRQSPKGQGRTGALSEIPNFSWSSIEREFRDRRHNVELVDESSQDLIDRADANVITRANHHRAATRRARDGYDSRREPLAMRVVLVNMIAESETIEARYSGVRKRAAANFRLPDRRRLWLDESVEINTDFFVGGQWRFASGENRSWHNLDSQHVSSAGSSRVRIEMDHIPGDNVTLQFRLTLRVNKSNTNGLSWYNTIWIAHRVMHRGVRRTSLKESTTVHETGHFIGMTDDEQSTHYTEHGHRGNHCSTGLSDAERERDSYSGLSGTCVMFGESASGRSSQFCSTCDPFVRTRRIRLRRMPSNW